MANPLLARERYALRSRIAVLSGSRERTGFTRCVGARVLLGNLPTSKAGGLRLRACYGWVS